MNAAIGIIFVFLLALTAGALVFFLLRFMAFSRKIEKLCQDLCSQQQRMLRLLEQSPGGPAKTNGAHSALSGSSSESRLKEKLRRPSAIKTFCPEEHTDRLQQTPREKEGTQVPELSATARPSKASECQEQKGQAADLLELDSTPRSFNAPAEIHMQNGRVIEVSSYVIDGDTLYGRQFNLTLDLDYRQVKRIVPL